MPVMEGSDSLRPVGAPGGAIDPDLTQPEIPVISKTKELQLFMMSVRNQSSGSYSGSYSGPQGAYGIDPGRWDLMARRAGLGGADMRDPGMQDYVAAWTMKALYGRYHNWNLVALAWSNGTGAADSVIKQSNKNPDAVSLADIELFYKGGFTAGVVHGMAKLGWKNIQGEADLDPGLTQLGSQQPHRTITGTGNVAIEDTYNATIRALLSEADAEKRSNAPSASEIMFQQIDGWSQSVAGGARADYRTDVSEVQSDVSQASGSGSGQELKPMEIEER